MPNEIVIVRDKRVYGDTPGKYGLVRADEWCEYKYEVTLWRGPDKPDERVETEHLMEVTCKNVQVDNQGFFVCAESEGREFYPCPEMMTKGFIDIVEKKAEEMLEAYANQHAAEIDSYIGYERMVEKLGDDWRDEIFSTGEFDKGYAVNGEPVTRKKDLNPPRGWIKTDFGGRSDGGEAEIAKSELAELMVYPMREKIKISSPKNILFRVLDLLYPQHKEVVVWSSDYGDNWVYLSKKAMEALASIEEAEGKREWSASYETDEDKRRRKIEERIKAARERREEADFRREEKRKIREGGYPDPRDWSPRGELPG